ncbi:hypothetical protein ACHQM5_015179 [Ranunculus cassubicifolius]
METKPKTMANNIAAFLIICLVFSPGFLLPCVAGREITRRPICPACVCCAPAPSGGCCRCGCTSPVQIQTTSP